MSPHSAPSPNRDNAVKAELNGMTSPLENYRTQHVVALALAILTTATSLGIATYAGWQRGGLLVERMMNVTLCAVAVLFVHLLPMGCHMLRVPVRICAVAMWCVSIVVVMYGQVSFFVVSHQHAGDQRASTVMVTALPYGPGLPSSRTLTDIAKDVARVSGDLASVNVRPCAGKCPTLQVRRAILVAQLTALNTEAGEAKRREVEEDRRNDQADRNEALRATLRGDPVALMIASWFGMTEPGLELILAVACAVVLEGAATIGWLLVSVGSGRAEVVSASGLATVDRVGSREPIASSREEAASEREAVEPGQTVAVGETADGLFTSEDDLLLKKIHEAVVTGEIRPTQAAIRKHLGCAQPKAGSLNRQYLIRFGSMRDKGGDVWAPSAAMPTLADA